MKGRGSYRVDCAVGLGLIGDPEAIREEAGQSGALDGWKPEACQKQLPKHFT